MTENSRWIEILGTVFFALAVVHSFLVKKFAQWSHRFAKDSMPAGLLHLASEIEIVFGLWAAFFLIGFALISGTGEVIRFQSSLQFSEPIFVFCIMVISATQPILYAVQAVLQSISRSISKLIKVPIVLTDNWVVLSFGTLLGSLITEPAAMTVSALLLFQMHRKPSTYLAYGLLGVLFVNISIGGALSSFAAPPILMVANKWQWDSGFIFAHFGWKAMLAVGLNSFVFVAIFRRKLLSECLSISQALDTELRGRLATKTAMPWSVVFVHSLFLIGVILAAHHSALVMGIFLFFLGLTSVTKKYHQALRLKESLLVAFFLAGLVVFGGFQKWWLQPLLTQMSDLVLFFGATVLTAVTDNAALTYLGSQVEGLSEAAKYFLVAGSITGGGLTVIANAPNPAGYSILQSRFRSGINPMGLFLGALGPTLVALLFFGMLV